MGQSALRHTVERQLIHTVNRVVGIVYCRGHAVLSTAQHDAATEDTTEVGTLDGVHDTPGIERTEA